MKRVIATLLLALLTLEPLAFAGIGGDVTMYVGGTENQIKGGAEGKSSERDEKNFIFQYKGGSLTRIIREVEDARSLFCYKHVVKAVFVLQERLPACSTIARHSVCYFPTFFTSLPYCSSTNGWAVPMAGPFC